VGESKKFFIFFFGSTHVVKITHIGRPNNLLIAKDLLSLRSCQLLNTGSNMRQYDQNFAHSALRSWWDAPVGSC
jgi:hypothetical protein